jgi:hypothetical protein
MFRPFSKKYTRLESLTNEKHISLVDPFVKLQRKKCFVKIGVLKTSNKNTWLNLYLSYLTSRKGNYNSRSFTLSLYLSLCNKRVISVNIVCQLGVDKMKWSILQTLRRRIVYRENERLNSVNKASCRPNVCRWNERFISAGVGKMSVGEMKGSFRYVLAKCFSVKSFLIKILGTCIQLKWKKNLENKGASLPTTYIDNCPLK